MRRSKADEGRRIQSTLRDMVDPTTAVSTKVDLRLDFSVVQTNDSGKERSESSADSAVSRYPLTIGTRARSETPIRFQLSLECSSRHENR